MANLEWTPIGGPNLVYGVLHGVLSLLPTLQQQHMSEKAEETAHLAKRVESLCQSRIPVSEWTSALCNDFLRAACRPARAKLLALKDTGMPDAERSAALSNIIMYCDVLCSIVAEVGPTLAPQPKQEVVALWAMARLTSGENVRSIEEFVYSATMTLARTTLSEEELLTQMQVQCVLYVASLPWSVRNSMGTTEIATACVYCAALLRQPGLHSQVLSMLKGAAGALGVPIPVDRGDGNSVAPVVVNEEITSDVIRKIVVILRQRGGIRKFTDLGDEFKRQYGHRIPEIAGMPLNDILAQAEQDGLLKRWGAHPNQYACLPGYSPPVEWAENAGTTNIENAVPRYTVVDDLHYRSIFSGGDAVTQLRRFITDNRDDIELILLRRLADLSPHIFEDNLLKPTGHVIARTDSEERVLNAAHDDLDQGRWQDAAAKFAEVAVNTPQGKNSRVCQNYQAYALAKAGSLWQARELLRTLTNSGFTYASAYWNLACCTPDDDHDAEQRKLSILASGLEYAPDVQLLAAALTFAITHRSNDPRVTKWLYMLPMSEALLLAFDIRFESLERNSTERDWEMSRLSKYAEDGEPQPPTFVGRAHFQDMSAYLEQLKLQPEAAEFWLRCRELVDGSNFDFWWVKSDFLERYKRMPEAALAFRQELIARMRAFAKRLKKFPGDRPPAVIRVRAEVWLRKCLADNSLRAIGHQIYTTFAAVGWKTGLPEEALQQMRPINDQIIAAFAASTTNSYHPQVRSQPAPIAPAPIAPAPIAPAAPSTLSPSTSYAPSYAPQTSPEPLSALLERAGNRCMAELRDLGDLPALTPTFHELLREIDQSGYHSCASELAILVARWRSISRLDPLSSEGRRLLSEATQAYDRLLDATHNEMRLGERSTMQDLMRALRRLNARLEDQINVQAFGVAPPPPSLENSIANVNAAASGSVYDAPESVTSQRQTVGLFVDLLNLTDGTGTSAITLTTNRTDSGIPGRFQLATVLDAIERYAQSLGSMATRRAVDYPRGCPAVRLCESRGYIMAPISSMSTKQGTDDQVLIAHMTKVALAFPSVRHFILVSGDIDFQPISDAFLSVGKYVHVVCRKASAPSREKVARLLRMYPGQFTFVAVEELFEDA